MNVGSLFSGIGGFDLGLERAGFHTSWFCEQDDYCRRVLNRHWPGVPVYPDVTTLTAEDVEPVEVLCGGFPCQDLSLAGKGAGIDGARSGLWSEFARLIGELRPRYVIVENVPALLSRGIWRVTADLAALGYDTEWDCLPASAVGAPHRRDRVWIVAYPGSEGLEGHGGTFGNEAEVSDPGGFGPSGSTLGYPESVGRDEERPKEPRTYQERKVGEGMSNRGGNTVSQIKVFGEAEQRTIRQLRNCLAVEEGSRGVLCADNHVGYSQPIGGAVAYRDHISPSGVGYDIGCGNKAVMTDLLAEDVDVAATMDEIVRRVSFGMGRNNNEPADHAVLDAIKEADFAPQRQLYDLASKQLGTVGAGNHYVDLFSDEAGRLWIGVHFGSRGFGHKTASGFLALAQGKKFEEHANEGEMDSPPIVFGTDTDLGQAYISAMTLAGEYAYAGRDVVVDTVLDILGAEAVESIHNHHNFAWREEHDGEEFWVVRKGCTPAWPGQKGFVGSTMGEDSVILEGADSPESSEALFSTVHGAGRVMSRTEAAGKNRKRWSCNNRDCDWFQGPGEHKPESGVCPKCGHDRLGKRMVQMKPGRIDFNEVLDDLAVKNIELRGGAADEAPGAYKRLPEVLAAQGDTIRVLHTLTPVGVAMAGDDIFDPFKD